MTLAACDAGIAGLVYVSFSHAERRKALNVAAQSLTCELGRMLVDLSATSRSLGPQISSLMQGRVIVAPVMVNW